ncbi:DUF5677 domain-containing protein [Clostridium weizhouense]|uniref:Uncharacterized protein n=1 Tax=Clostridium weizhouense TaxID=2859781 RepID=A0ABS7AJC7_9CLOT|nr:DUF5677 domain-containing protein [Clostridium weizhouense]MBW6408774.1 hypothetical protein [Clostridium weizhouense]
MAEDMVVEIMNEGIMEAIKSKVKDKNKDIDIEEFFKSIDYDGYFRHTLDTISNHTLDYFEKTMYEIVMEKRNETNEFLARQEQKWGKCFVVSDAMYIMTLEASEKYCEYVSELDKQETQNKDYLFLSLREIHARALQQFLEITCLMKNGFADGAYARWRSMYELSIIADFINQNGENVAKAYFEATNTNDRYDWAKTAQCLKNIDRHITFADIQRQCHFATRDWKRQYNLANKVVHASPQGTFGRMSRYSENDNLIIAGRSDYGITTPAEHSAISLVIISSLFFTLFPNGDSLVTLKCLNEWIYIIRKYYFTAHNEIFDDDKIEFEEGERDE